MKPLIYLIDGNAIGFACNSGPKLSVGKQATQATFGVIRTLREMQMRNPQAKKFMLWDGKAKWRYDLYPEYKSNRNKDPKSKAMRAEYKSQQPDIEKAVCALGIDQVRSNDCEADDLAAAYAFIFGGKQWKTQLVTGDGDWLQLVNEHIEWFDPIRDKFVNHQNFTSQTGFRDPAQFVDNKCLMGDTSDTIKGVGGIGEKGAAQLLKAYGRVSTFLKLYKDGKVVDIPKAWIALGENLKGSQDRYWRNRKLMELRPNVPGVKDRQTIKGEFDPAAFRHLCEDLAFWSILKDFDTWVAPFAPKIKAAA